MLLSEGDEEQSGQNVDDYMSKMAVQAVEQFRKSQQKMKYLLRQIKDIYKQIMIKNQKILLNILNSPQPMTEKQAKDLKKSLTITVKLVAYIKAKEMIDKETQKQLYVWLKPKEYQWETWTKLKSK